MSKTYLKQFEFELWSNTMILNSLRQLNEPVERASFLFSHLLSSHSMWMSRLTKTPITCTLFQERTLDECEALMQENTAKWKVYLTEITEETLDSIIHFDGAWDRSKRNMRIEDALIHLINHSSYHRGQIVQSIKDKIDPLPISTYIIFAS
jgi:uncharacterized damage-inducible protein DinB